MPRSRRCPTLSAAMLPFRGGLFLLLLLLPVGTTDAQPCGGGGACGAQTARQACCSAGGGCTWHPGPSCGGHNPSGGGGHSSKSGGGQTPNQQGGHSPPPANKDCGGPGDCTTRTSRSTCCDLQRSGSCTWSRPGDAACGQAGATHGGGHSHQHGGGSQHGQQLQGGTGHGTRPNTGQPHAGAASCSGTVVLDPLPSQFLTLEVYQRLSIRPQAHLEADPDGQWRMNQLSTTCRGCQCPDGVTPSVYGNPRGDDKLGFECSDGSKPDTSVSSCCSHGEVCAAGIPLCSSCCQPCRYGTLSVLLKEFPMTAKDMAAASPQQGANGPIMQTYHAVHDGDEPVCLYGKAVCRCCCCELRVRF
eukprot:SAG25_NODE_630_length_6325_cov_14.712175_2_plen_359_part_00